VNPAKQIILVLRTDSDYEDKVVLISMGQRAEPSNPNQAFLVNNVEAVRKEKLEERLPGINAFLSLEALSHHAHQAPAAVAIVDLGGSSYRMVPFLPSSVGQDSLSIKNFKKVVNEMDPALFKSFKMNMKEKRQQRQKKRR
jgi:hypothetical protein